jgi:hypothetical protein
LKLKENKSYSLIILFGILVIVQAVWVMNSNGFYFIDDGCHFNYNRHFFSSYFASLGFWHRLGRVWLFTLPAQLGLKGVQIFSALIFLATILIAYKILKLKKVPFAEWIVPVIGFQPVLFNISYTVLAELPAAFLIVLSYYFYLKDKPVLTMLSSSLIFMFRTEYYFVAGLFLLIYLFRKKWITLPLFLTGPFIWFIVSWIIQSDWQKFFYDMTEHARLPRITEGVDWYYYLYHFADVFGFVQCFFFLIALSLLIFNKKIKDYGFVLLIFFGGIFIQTMFALKELDLTCSIGQLRYIAVVGPMFGIISAAGFGYFYEALSKWYIRLPVQIILLIVMFLLGPYATPFHNKYRIEEESERIAKLHDEKYKDYIVLSNLYQVANAMDEADKGGKEFKKLTQSNIEKYGKVLIIWSRELEGSPFVEETVTLDKLEQRKDAKLLYTITEKVNRNSDIPIFKYYDWNKKFRRDLIEYLVFDQYSWENFQIKVFVKE